LVKHIPFQDKAPGETFRNLRAGGVKKIETPKDSALIHTPLGVTAEVLGRLERFVGAVAMAAMDDVPNDSSGK
jgi:hypothetical protein